MRLTLARRYTLLISLTLLLSLGGLAWLLLRQGDALTGELTELGARSLEQVAQRQQNARARLLADFLEPNLTGPLYYYDFPALQRLIGTALKQSDVRYLMVYDREGRIVSDGAEGVDRFGSPMNDPLAAAALAASERLLQRSADTLELNVPLKVGAERIGGFRLGLTLIPAALAAREDRTALETAARQSLRERGLRLFGLLALIALLGTLVAALISRGLIAPIRQLRRHAQSIQRGEYDVRLESSRADEIGDLMRAFDRMGEAIRYQHAEITHLAYDDPLTGLPNRLKLREIIVEHLRDQSTAAAGIMLIDLDDFKRINDTLGHDLGDQLLREFASRLKTWVQETAAQTGLNPDCIIRSRFGGDEFVLWIRSEKVRVFAQALGEKLLSRMETAFVFGETRLIVSPSIGVTVYPDDGTSLEVLLKNADLAMYQSKQSGKNALTFFAQNLVQVANERLSLEGELRLALERGEISMLYQPLYQLEPRRLIGAEALMRWNHKRFGTVHPAVFIPLAEDTDLIAPLGAFAIHEACRQIAAWAECMPADFYVSVNVSIKQLRRQDVAAIVETAVQSTGIELHHLALEITESSLFDNHVRANQQLLRLREMGVKLWLDDFGTGFSGLSQLRRTRVHGVKIDRSFIADMTDDPEDLAITTAIIAMAHSLNMKVTAEGIETAEQLELLKQRHCDTGQGYGLGRPEDAASMAARMAGKS